MTDSQIFLFFKSIGIFAEFYLTQIDRIVSSINDYIILCSFIELFTTPSIVLGTNISDTQCSFNLRKMYLTDPLISQSIPNIDFRRFQIPNPILFIVGGFRQKCIIKNGVEIRFCSMPIFRYNCATKIVKNGDNVRKCCFFYNFRTLSG